MTDLIGSSSVVTASLFDSKPRMQALSLLRPVPLGDGRAGLHW